MRAAARAQELVVFALLILATAGLKEALVGRFAATLFAMATKSRPARRIALAAFMVALVAQPGAQLECRSMDYITAPSEESVTASERREQVRYQCS